MIVTGESEILVTIKHDDFSKVHKTGRRLNFEIKYTATIIHTLLPLTSTTLHIKAITSTWILGNNFELIPVSGLRLLSLSNELLY